jgi:DNA-binding transcriptional regulator YdaS (Cro superfamily)
MTLSIERATQGLVTRHELRPDLYPVDAGKVAA